MDATQREKIISNLRFIKDNLGDIVKMADILIERKIVSFDQGKEIKSCGADYDKVDKMIDLLLRSPQIRTYDTFVHALKITSNGAILQKLQETYITTYDTMEVLQQQQSALQRLIGQSEEEREERRKEREEDREKYEKEREETVKAQREFNDRFENFQKDFDSILGQNDVLKSLLQNREEKIKELEESQQKNTLYQTKYDLLQKQFEEKEKELANVASEKKELEKENKNLTTKIINLKGELQEIKGKVSNLEKLMSKKGSDMKIMEDTIANINDKIARINVSHNGSSNLNTPRYNTVMPNQTQSPRGTNNRTPYPVKTKLM